MRGAAFEVRDQLDEVVIVDIGGTTTDIRLVQTSSFSRQDFAYNEFAGVYIGLFCPDVKISGVGGGHIVRKGTEKLSVGPDNVGGRVKTKTVVFGGSTVTATYFTVLAYQSVSIGGATLVQGAIDASGLAQFTAIVRQKIENVVDAMKTSPNCIPALLVGVAPSPRHTS
ncbi:hydantoin utilization protein A 1 [Colletotrichum tofieldiae]|nr:hydantoin utilization protein A 1 [Colletotrichum tofieldiae]GKT76449.1 hydantoin utilization protein A 1 [Colletotrichum tofieldiae]GKT87495.1 hydantoin utilization protein A 1 [Colletotrichum tofieldiae]